MPAIRNQIRELRETAFKVALELGVPLEQCFQYDPKGKR
jgi:hypothetical protein